MARHPHDDCRSCVQHERLRQLFLCVGVAGFFITGLVDNPLAILGSGIVGVGLWLWTAPKFPLAQVIELRGRPPPPPGPMQAA